MIRRLPALALTALAALAALPEAHAGSVAIDLGTGYSMSSAPAMHTKDTSTLDFGTVGEEFSGFHLFLTVSIPIGRWVAPQFMIAGAFESGVVENPATLWFGNPILGIPGTIIDASRRTVSYLAGLRLQDRNCAWRVDPWAYAMAGFATQTLELEEDALYAERIFYPDGDASQSGLALSFGLGADVKILRWLGLRLGAEYQPIFLGDEVVLKRGEGKTLLNDQPYTSAQEVKFVGEAMHQWRFIVGPMVSF